MIIHHSDMSNNLRDTVRCLPAQHKHPERCRVHNNTSTNSTNKQHAHMYGNISREKTVISQLNKWFASYLICKISPLYSRGGFYFSPSTHWLPLIPWVIPSVSQHKASYAWKEGRTKRWREQRRKGSYAEGEEDFFPNSVLLEWKRDVPNVGKSSDICAGSEMTQAVEIFDLMLIWLSLRYELTNTKLYKLRTRWRDESRIHLKDQK